MTELLEVPLQYKSRSFIRNLGRVFWTGPCCKRRLHGPWKLRNRHRRRIILRLYHALGRMACWDYGHASPISLRKTGNCHGAFSAGHDTTAPEGPSLYYSLLARIRGGRPNDGSGPVSGNCHSSVPASLGFPDLLNFVVGLSR